MNGRRKLTTLWCIIICAIFVGGNPVLATDWYVDDNAPLDPAPGDPNISDPLEDGSINHPFDSIQEAILWASGGDTVIVADGIYTGVGNRDIDFGGKAITVRSANGPKNCIIDCQGTEDNPHRGFIFHNEGDPNAIISRLDGLTITNGYGPREYLEYPYRLENAGGAIYCENSSPIISNCIIKNNQAFNGGGILCNGRGDVIIRDCTIENNEALDVGDVGGICCYNSRGTRIINCTLQNNSAHEGGGISCKKAKGIKIRDCTIDGNYDISGAGGIETSSL